MKGGLINDKKPSKVSINVGKPTEEYNDKSYNKKERKGEKKDITDNDGGVDKMGIEDRGQETNVKEENYGGWSKEYHKDGPE